LLTTLDLDVSTAVDETAAIVSFDRYRKAPRQIQPLACALGHARLLSATDQKASNSHDISVDQVGAAPPVPAPRLRARHRRVLGRHQPELALPFGVKSESHDSQVIQAIERTQEVALLSLGIQGIKEEKRCAEAFGKCVPGTGETVFLQYNFAAKLGIDGAEVKVTKTGEGAYLISGPEFTFIGYDEPTFKVAVEDGGALDWATPDIDKVEMVNEILNDDARKTYLASNEDLLQEQTKVFCDSLIASIDPALETTFEFRS
jgi:hypothetical protein